MFQLRKEAKSDCIKMNKMICFVLNSDHVWKLPFVFRFSLKENIGRTPRILKLLEEFFCSALLMKEMWFIIAFN